MKAFKAILLLAGLRIGFSQSSSLSENNTSFNDSIRITMPAAAPYGDAKAYSDLDHKAFFKRYYRPPTALPNKWKGEFKIVFYVSSEGKIIDWTVLDVKRKDVKNILSGKRYGVVAEIRRVIQLYINQSKWTPAIKQGKSVKSTLSFTLTLSHTS